MNYHQQITQAKKDNKPFTAFKNPNNTTVNVIIQSTDELIVFDDFTLSGYVFAPFDDSETAYILRPDVVFEDTVRSIKFDKKNSVFKENKKSRENHINLVQKTVKAIEQTELSKVVVSRKEKINLSNFDLIDTFDRLMYQYPNAYVYVFYHPKIGLWMGATPETLININGNKFKTMALAGTQSYDGNLKPKWGSKELQEQQMVTDFIKNRLEKLVNNLCLSDRETVKAGNLLHLKTTIEGVIKNKKDVKSLIKLLHPTPAVCGLPKELSKAFILKNEGYKRMFYTGYLGVLNMNNLTSLFVNLRCFQVVKQTAYLYVGGGITANSIPQSEWNETVFKSITIKAVL